MARVSYGAVKAVPDETSPWYFSTSTSVVFATQPWASLEDPLSQGQNVHIAMLVESVDFAWMLRVIPTAFAYQDNAGPNSVGHDSAGERLPTVVEDSDYLAVPDPACRRIFGV